MAKRYITVEEMVADLAEMVRPPERLSVPEAAERYRWIENPGNYVGPFKNEQAPYMIEPGEVLTSPDYTAMVFVGPAQSAKTELVNSWITHSAICDPADMMIVQTTNSAARDFSKRRVARLYRDTPELQKRIAPGKNSQNVLDTVFRSGMILTLSHPSINELSGKPIPRVWLTDYDRMDDDVDGEGSPFDLARKRTTTFRRFGMTVAESSPGRTVTTSKWIPESPHEAEPTTGILALYNRGDRRRWYWKCPSCSEAFEPAFKLLRWDNEETDHLTAAENAHMECPHCAHQIQPSEKFALNIAGRWIKDGQQWERDGSITGKARRSNVASFWLKGAAAAFADWSLLVLNWLKANEEYDKTGSEEALKTTVNTDQGDPYTPKEMEALRLPDELKARAEDWGGSADNPVVPEGVRFLVATVDVQAGSRSAFVVHVYGYGEGSDVWHIDMRKIRKSRRVDEDGDRLNIDPAAYPEDWDILTDEVIEAQYPLADGSGRVMQIKMTGCDSGGADGVTTNAYNYWRSLRDAGKGYHQRFQLVKGDPTRQSQRAYMTWPDSQRKDRKANARGEIPVLMLNSNLMKDLVSNKLGRIEPGGGMVHFPIWAENWLYTQLTAEQRTAKGWVGTSKRRNEALDLLYYAEGICLDKRIKIEAIDWERPPSWAAEWDKNALVVTPEGFSLVTREKKRRSLKELGEDMG